MFKLYCDSMQYYMHLSGWCLKVHSQGKCQISKDLIFPQIKSQEVLFVKNVPTNQIKLMILNLCCFATTVLFGVISSNLKTIFEQYSSD